MAGRSPSAIRSAPRGRASCCTCCTCSSAPEAGAASRRSASAAVWAARCWSRRCDLDVIPANAGTRVEDMANNYKHWKLETDRDKLAWLSFDKQGASTNTLSQETLAELDAALDEARALAPRGLVIRSGKPSGFIAGADVEEFTKIQSPQDALSIVRRGWDLFNKLAALPFPTVALIDGFCMGGGLELAMACRYRVAVDQPGTRLALPEVMLGILPGWGGVQRLPRLVGPGPALDMLMTGRSIDARRAKRMGLVDAAVPPRIKENTARMIALEAPRPRRLPLAQALMNLPFMRPLVAAMARRQLRARAKPE